MSTYDPNSCPDPGKEIGDPATFITAITACFSPAEVHKLCALSGTLIGTVGIEALNHMLHLLAVTVLDQHVRHGKVDLRSGLAQDGPGRRVFFVAPGNMSTEEVSEALISAAAEDRAETDVLAKQFAAPSAPPEKKSP